MLHIVWEFLVKPGWRKDFERHYASSGTWAQLFSKGKGYIETVCLKDTQNKHRYLVIDRWENVDAFGEFKIQFADEYRRLDEQCTAFTREEKQIGFFAD